MRYWLCVTDKKNWEVMRKTKIWGVSKNRRHTIQKVKRGDKLVIYLKEERVGDELLPSRIVAICEAESEAFISHRKIFNPPRKKINEIFPYRIKIKPIKIFDKPIEFKPLIPKLKFIKDGRNWKAYVRLCMREIPKEDFETILSHGGVS